MKKLFLMTTFSLSLIGCRVQQESTAFNDVVRQVANVDEDMCAEINEEPICQAQVGCQPLFEDDLDTFKACIPLKQEIVDVPDAVDEEPVTNNNDNDNDNSVVNASPQPTPSEQPSNPDQNNDNVSNSNPPAPVENSNPSPSDQQDPVISSNNQTPPPSSSNDGQPPVISSNNQTPPPSSSNDGQPPVISSNNQTPPSSSSNDDEQPPVVSTPPVSSENDNDVVENHQGHDHMPGHSCDKDKDKNPADLDHKYCGQKNNKMLICHIPAGNPREAHTLCISRNAWDAHRMHKKHGPQYMEEEVVVEYSKDYVGPCVIPNEDV